jgi:hypothetical protein
MTTPVDQTFTIQEELKRGLRRDDRNIRNQYTLSQCKNARPTERGLEKAPNVTDPFDPYSFKTGGELLTNGSFTSGSTGWTAGADWTFASGRAYCNGSATLADRQLSQATTALANVYYVVRVTLEGVNPGDNTMQGALVVWLDLTPSYPAYSRQIIAGVQVLDFVIKSPVSNPTLTLQGSEGGYLAVNAVSMYAALYGSWPSPQIFRGKSETILLFDGEVHNVNETVTPWTSSAHTVINGTYYPQDLIVNGDFVTRQYWTLATGWTWTGVTGTIDVSTAAPANATYTDPGSVPVIGFKYRIVVDVIKTSGTITVDFGGIGGALSTGNNIFTGTASTTNNLKFVVAAAAVASIYHVSVFRDETTALNITGGGGPWSFVDAHGFWVACNEANILIRTPEGARRVYKMPNTVATACCEYKGRMFFAGFNGGTDYGIWGTMNANFVWWSAVGGGNIVELFRKNFRNTTNIDALIKRNDSGYAVMPWQGTVKQLAPLGAGVIAFGDQGVAALIQYGEPVPTFGTKAIISQVGIISRGAMGVAPDRLVFVDTSGSLWVIYEDLRTERLGYSEYFEPLLDQDSVISYDRHRDEFWIVTPEKCYILNKFGLGENNKLPTTINFVEGGLVGVQYYQKSFTVFNDGEHLDDFAAAVDTFDMGNREIKTIHTVEIGITDPTVVEVSLYYRYNKGLDFEQTAWKTLDKNGIAVFLTSGVEFQLALRTEEFSETILDYITVNWRQNRKKSVRDLILANA